MDLRLTQWGLFAIVILLNSAANILLKKASSLPVWPLNIWLVAALACFAGNVLSYRIVLAYLPVSLAYPLLVGSTIALVSGYALLRMGETISPWHIAGFAFILCGIVILCAQAPKVSG